MRGSSEWAALPLAVYGHSDGPARRLVSVARAMGPSLGCADLPPAPASTLTNQLRRPQLTTRPDTRLGLANLFDSASYYTFSDRRATRLLPHMGK